MPTLHVCPLSRLDETIAAAGPSHLVSLLGPGAAVARPGPIAADHHLIIRVNDILEPMEGYVLAGPEHMEPLIAFIRAWGREAPLLFHCWAGISRSTAAAYIAACALAPGRDEAAIADALRAAAPSATPNRHFVALADELLGRGGRMVDSIRAIGRGAEAMEGEPFMLQLNRG